MDENNLIKTLKEEDKVNLVKGFRVKKVKAGQRIYKEESDTIDCVHLILRGKTGILYLEKEMNQILREGSLAVKTVLLNENQVATEKAS